MTFRILTSIKRWWRNHRWVDIRDNRIIPYKNDTFWLTDYSVEEARKFKKDNPSKFYRYIFTPGPIGVSVEIEGNGEVQNITDYGSW